MRKPHLLLLTLIIISCNASSDNNSKEVTVHKDSLKETQAPQQTDNTSWIDSFRVFRNAVYQNDRAKVKQFIDFPIMNENNEIWYLAHEGSDSSLNLLSDKIKPFTEADFDKYYSKIFPKTFIKSILKIKTEELNKDGEFTTIELEEGNTTYKIYAAFDKKQNTLILNLASNTPVKVKDRDGKEIEDPGEYSVAYYFDILNNGQIKFRQVRLAG
ncbi:MAG TPA: hypothetical protein VGQ09_19430 [Chitinophagaceae bacterium]|jgi:hypothetical protein|nr:hypothetical protein [Chitinophagaceae bacterium]